MRQNKNGASHTTAPGLDASGNHGGEPPQTRGRSKNKKADGENPTATRYASKSGFCGNHRGEPPQTRGRSENKKADGENPTATRYALKLGFWGQSLNP